MTETKIKLCAVFLIQLIVAGFTNLVVAESPEISLVKDIRPGLATLAVKKACNVNGMSFYFVSGENDGELWVATAGDSSVKRIPDVAPYLSDELRYSNCASLHGEIYFRVNYTRELWKSDGTVSGTKRVQGPNLPAMDVTDMLPVGEQLFFGARGSAGEELYVTDGTLQGMRQIKVAEDPISHSGSSSSQLSSFTEMNGNLYFFVDFGQAGFQLWKSDGTDAGTRVVKAVGVEGAELVAYNLTKVGDWLYFLVADVSENSKTDKSQLWISNGSESDTQRVGTVLADGRLAKSGSNSIAYFFGSTDESVANTSLWKIENGKVHALNYEIPDSLSYKCIAATVGSKVIFVARNVENFISSLNAVDITNYSTTKLFELYDSGYQCEEGSYAQTADSLLYLVNGDYYSSPNLWRTDGTVSGSVKLKFGFNSQIGATELVNLGSKVVTTAKRYNPLTSSYDEDLWEVDAAGIRLSTLLSDTFASSQPDILGSIGSKLIFTANDGSMGRGLWVSDGSTLGTSVLMPAENTANDLAYARHILTDKNGNMFFISSESGNDIKLWHTDGTEGGTGVISNLDAGDSVYNPQLAMLGDNLIILICDYYRDSCTVWTSPKGYKAAEKVFTLPGEESLSNFRVTGVAQHGQRVYFTVLAYSGAGEQRVSLWVTDGTASGTSRLLSNGEFKSINILTTTVSGLVIYTRSTESDALWLADGITGSINRYIDFNGAVYSPGKIKDNLVNGATDFFLSIDDSKDLYSIWRTDGTADGTTRVKELPMLYYDDDPWSFLKLGGGLFFKYGNNQLWRSNGTADGTYRFAETFFDSSQLVPLATAFDMLIYPGSDIIGIGVEPWISDGTALGSRILADVNPGEASSNPAGFTQAGSNTFFVANHASSGRELWVYRKEKLVVDLCLEDPLKTAPGVCGCGIADSDKDQDGTLDCQDSCPSDPAKIVPGSCGCSIPDADLNKNSILDCQKGSEFQYKVKKVLEYVTALKTPVKKSRRLIVKSIAKQLLDLLNALKVDVSGEAKGISVKSGSNLRKLVDTVISSSKAVAKLKVKTNAADRKRAKAAISKLLVALT